MNIEKKNSIPFSRLYTPSSSAVKLVKQHTDLTEHRIILKTQRRHHQQTQNFLFGLSCSLRTFIIMLERTHSSLTIFFLLLWRSFFLFIHFSPYFVHTKNRSIFSSFTNTTPFTLLHHHRLLLHTLYTTITIVISIAVQKKEIVQVAICQVEKMEIKFKGKKI